MSSVSIFYSISLSFLWITPLAILGWAYYRTRLPAVLVYLLWRAVGSYIMGNADRAMLRYVVHLERSGMGVYSAQDASVVLMLVSHTIEVALLAWLVFSLVRWASTHRTLGLTSRPAI
jgi:hypothetical protein